MIALADGASSPVIPLSPDGSTPIRRVALIGNSVPRRCGLATFTSDCRHALTERFPDVVVDIYAMTDRGGSYAYPSEVRASIDQESLPDYIAAGRSIARSGADIVWLQHEFGIFGGAAGAQILPLLDASAVPIVVTLHTVLAEPNDEQRAVMRGLIDRAACLVVMAHHGRRLLMDVYGADPDRIAVVPHGIPDRPFERDDAVRRREGVAGRDVVMTFGLLSPNKGIEVMIEALPAIVRRFPQLLYMVVGATHPHLIRDQGEAYRVSLKRMADDLGVAGHVRWVDEFLETEELVDLIGMADIYVTPYLNPAQVTSGTLAYAVGLGKPVISTPYIHAREILSGGHGRLVPFGDAAALADGIVDLLSHGAEREGLRRRAYALGRTMIWPRLAEAMMTIFSRVRIPAAAATRRAVETRVGRDGSVGLVPPVGRQAAGASLALVPS